MAAEERFKSLIFTPRGGGTGTNGQALNAGIIVDMSRYMNRIIEINPEEGWVGGKPGSLKISSISSLTVRLLFAPEAVDQQPRHAWRDDQHRCTGQGSLVYGKTSDHVLACARC
ncbi:FAD-binding oxidoreductase [Escherichia coli]